MFEFEVPDWINGALCQDCREPIPLSRLEEGVCDDCEFDHLTPPGWLDAFLIQLDIWYRADERGYN